MAETFMPSMAMQAAISSLSGQIGALNSKVTKLNASDDINSNSTLANLKSRLLSIASDMLANDEKSRYIWFACTESPFSSGIPVNGYLTIYSANYFTALVSSINGHAFMISYNNGTWTFEELVLNSDIAKLGEYVAGTKNAVNCPNGGVATTIGTITLNKGRWIIFVNGWSPLGDVQETATQIFVSNTFGCSTISFRLFSMSGLVQINSDNTVLDLKVINWESQAKTADTAYNFYATRVGF